jgi:hypothetical protein
MVWIDESGIEQNMVKMQLWTKKGNEIITDNISGGKKHDRTTIIAGLNKEKVVLSPLYFKGTTDTETFVLRLEHCLVSELKEGQVVIMDNASIHKSKQIKEIMEEKAKRNWVKIII